MEIEIESLKKNIEEHFSFICVKSQYIVFKQGTLRGITPSKWINIAQIKQKPIQAH